MLADLPSAERAWIRTLTDAEDAAYAAASISRFPLASQMAIDWSGAEIIRQELVDDDAEALDVLLEVIPGESAGDPECVILWGSLGIPSIILPATAARRNLARILEVAAELWFFVPAQDLLIEYTMEGEVTAGRPPARG
ncbi:hypothetical protein ACFWUQ_20380 [Streptomyces sp. NPDC058662]|uniref:hypothetical protein n=1 Tax=Streptomyces sp. NPDC058662 TaxID=3346583 RepID=UPI00364EF155